MEVMANFTERLRQLRDESGKTQSQIAKELGLTPQAFSYFVNGREPNYETLGKIADYFQVSVDYLLGRSEVKTADTTVRDICEYTGLSEKVVNTLHTDMKREQEGVFGIYLNFVNKLADSKLFPALLVSLGLYQIAAWSLTKDEYVPDWVSLDINSSEMERKIEVYKRFNEEFKGVNLFLTGVNNLGYYGQRLINTIEQMLPDVAGVNYNDPEFIKREKEIAQRWDDLFTKVHEGEDDEEDCESIRIFTDKINDLMNGEAPNDKTPAG